MMEFFTVGKIFLEYQKMMKFGEKMAKNGGIFGSSMLPQHPPILILRYIMYFFTAIFFSLF